MLWGIAIDEFTQLDALKKAFEAKFKLMRDDNDIVAKIYNTKQGKNENEQDYNCRLKELQVKLENQPADGMKKRYFIDNTTINMARFIYEQIFTQYDIPIRITSDWGGPFMNHAICLMMTKLWIFHSLSSLYYLRANGQAESTNKEPISIIHKLWGIR